MENTKNSRTVKRIEITHTPRYVVAKRETNTHAHVHRQSNTGWQGIGKGVGNGGNGGSGGSKPRDSHINKRNQRENISQSGEPGK